MSARHLQSLSSMRWRGDGILSTLAPAREFADNGFLISDFRVYGLMRRSGTIDSGLLLEREHTLGNA